MKKAIGIVSFLIVSALIIFGVAFASVNGFINFGNKSLDGTIGEIQTKFDSEFMLETQSAEITIPYDSGGEYKQFGEYKIPFTKNQVEFNYKFNVRAGVKDLTKAEIKPKGKDTIVVILPHAEVLNESSEMGEVTDAKQKNNPINPVDIDKVEEIKKGLNQVAIDKAVEEGLLVRAENHAQEVLENELKDIIDEYHIEVEWK